MGHTSSRTVGRGMLWNCGRRWGFIVGHTSSVIVGVMWGFIVGHTSSETVGRGKLCNCGGVYSV